MIYTFIAYAPSRGADLGWTYNRFMGLLPHDGDWACFLDHDAMFTTSDWYQQLEEIVDAHPEVGCFTAMTNRIGNPAQVVPQGYHGHDIRYHRQVGKALSESSRRKIEQLPAGLMSGVVMLVKKSTWNKVKFTSGFLGVDNQFHLDCVTAGFTVKLMRGVYVYHWYRAKLEEV